MSISNYGELKAALANWSNRSDLTAVIPDFVAYAHQQVLNNFRSPILLSTTQVTVGTELVAPPTDFLAPFSLYLDTDPRVEIKLVTAESRVQLAAQYNSSDYPAWYAVQGAQLAFAPAFTGSATGELTYYAAPTRLLDDANANAVLTAYPFVYLFGGLSALFSYLEDEQRADRWEQKFRQMVRDINVTDRNDATRAPLSQVPYQGGIV